MAENEDLTVLDTSDPLNLIINSGPMDDSDPNASPPDWSQLGALWPEEHQSSSSSGNTKQFSEFIDFNMASDMLDMDLDMTLNSSAGGIEPSILKMGASERLGYHPFDDPFQFASASPADILAAQFPFAFNGGDTLMDTSSTGLETPNTKPRRLSVTSSSSSSGPSFSPLTESIPSPGYLSPGGGYTSDSTHHSSTASLANSENSQPAATINDAAQPPKPASTTTSHNTTPSSAQSPAADPAAELAQRVRQSAGVMLAVPMNGGGAPYQAGQLFPTAGALQTKLPIPRLQRPTTTTPPKSSTPSTTSSAASTPPPSTPPPGTAIPNGPPPSASPPSTATTTAQSINVPRPKTSHTTIERRYRTNLNARIQSLRMAVPALRVLEDRDSGGSSKKIKKNLKSGVLVKSATGAAAHGSSALAAYMGAGGELNPYGEVDVIDERGYVDGVKVARKCSKANVLGKAVEYIRVLKRREFRLRAEQDGLKALVCGLVGGPALLREWEREWRERFGGEERDEMPLDGIGEGDDEGDDEDDEDDDDEDGEGAGKKRKRAKVDKDLLPLPKKEPKPASAALTIDGQPEKRKRGRPRKTPLPPVPAESVQSVPAISAPVPTQPHQPQQYLLAVFAVFSFFNSPLTSSHGAHPSYPHGHVLSATPVPSANAPDSASWLVMSTITWRDWVQIAHLVVTVLLFVSVVARVGSSFGFSRVRAFVKRSSGNGEEEEKVEAIILGQDAIPSITSALTLYRSLPLSTSSVIRALFLYTLASSTTSPILMRPILRIRARALWASSPTTEKKHQVIFSSTLEDVYSALPYVILSKDTELVDAIAECLIKRRLGDVLGRLFVREVNSSALKDKEDAEEPTEDLETTLQAAKELGHEVASLARSVERIQSSHSDVSSPITIPSALAGWKAVVPGGNLSLEEEEESEDSDDSSLSMSVDSFDDDEIAEDEEEGQVPSTILRALVLYKSLFSSSSSSTQALGLGLLAPPSTLPTISIKPPTPTTPTPVRRRTVVPSTSTSKPTSALARMTVTPTTTEQRKRMYALRRLLGSRVFEKYGDVMEDARDRVVDMLVDAERQYLRA